MARRNGESQAILVGRPDAEIPEYNESEPRRPLSNLPAGSPVSIPAVREVVREIRTAIIEAPIGEPGPGYTSMHVEVRFQATESHQAESLKRLAAGLRDTREVLRNGREVRTAADAVRWVLEKLSDSE